MQQGPLTPSQAAARLGVPEWKLRRVVDRIAPQTPRVGEQRVRAIPQELLKTLAQELRMDGYLVSGSG